MPSAVATFAGVAGLPRNSCSDVRIWSFRPCEREQEAEAGSGIGGAEDPFGVVVEGFAHLDNRTKTALRFREIGVDVVLVFAADGAIPHEL